MATESTLRYATLRRTRTAIRVLAPIISSTLLLVGLTLFVGNVFPRLLAPGYGIWERMIWGAIGLGYLIGFPVAAFIFFFLLRAGADLIDLWIDSEVAAEKTADLVERQLVPGVHRMCQLLETTNESLARPAAATSDSDAKPTEARQQAMDAVREAVRREWWDEARRLAGSFAQQFPGALEAKALTTEVENAFRRRMRALYEQLAEAEQASNAEQVLNVRDRLSAYVEGAELEQLDRRAARWLTTHIREALAAGKGRDVLPLAERMVDALGDTTSEGAMVRASLPTMRRSAGLCPDCGQPYDIRLVRCPTCEAKRPVARPPLPSQQAALGPANRTN